MYVHRRLQVDAAGLAGAYAGEEVTLEDVALTREQALALAELPEPGAPGASEGEEEDPGGGPRRRPGGRGRRAVDALRPYERLAAVARRTDFRALPDHRRARQVLGEALAALQHALDQLSGSD
jgi:hypothetical protein